MAFAFPEGEAITHSHPSKEPKIDDSGVLLVRVGFFFFFFSSSEVVFPLYPVKNVLRRQGEDSSRAALEPSWSVILGNNPVWSDDMVFRHVYTD